MYSQKNTMPTKSSRMLSRSSFSMRGLISQRRPDSPRDTDEFYDDSDSAQLTLHQRRQSTRPAKHESKSADSLLIHKSQSVHRLTGPVPPLPTDSPRSSASSLYSFDHYVHPSSKENIQNGSLCLPRGKFNAPYRPATPKRLSERKHLIISPLQQISPLKSGIDCTPDQSPANKGGDDAVEPTVLLEEAVPEDQTEPHVDEWSETVQQLIWETDEAFQAVGAALARVQITWQPEMASAKPEVSLPSPPSSTPGFPWKPSAHLSWKKQPAKCTTPPLTPKKKASVSKVKRTKSKKSKMTRRPVVPSTRMPRWALGENMTDILKGQFFRKIEADEMLAPDRLQIARLSRDYQLRQTRSSETLFTDDSETPVEPFHLQDLPSRIGAAGVQTSVTPIDAVPLPIPFDQPVRRDFSVTKKTSSTHAKAETEDEDQIKLKTMAFPCPPIKNMSRYHSRTAQQSPPLATIPEVLVTIPAADEDDIMPPVEMRVQHRGRTFVPIDDEDFVFFMSTPCTLTMPEFRHGRIRFPKSEVVKGRKIAVDDTLDWTAFQMAILGGAGDFFSDPSDFAPRTESDESDELTEWFDDFGFENHGLLISSSSSGDSNSSTMTEEMCSPAASTITDTTDTDLPIPVAPEFPTGFWNEGHVDTSRFLRDQGHCKIRRWTMDGPMKRYKQDSQGSIESLPQSPEMDIVYLGGVHGEGDAVPMGFNLGHGLGEFLRWESENSYATPGWGRG